MPNNEKPSRPSLTSGLRQTARDVFVARQPIFNVAREVFGYELLFRSGGDKNSYDFPDGTVATTQVLVNSFLLFGMSNLTQNKIAFVNITREIMMREVLDLFPPALVIPELLESIVPDAEVLAACRRLKAQGYTLALDDFVALEGFEELATLADIIKVDFLQTTPEVQAELARRLLPGGARMLAEKVETHEDFARAVADGYTLFQGYFFAKPEIVQRKEIPGYKLHYLQLLCELGRQDSEIRDIEDIVKRDVSLSYRLLRYINSAGFGFRKPVESIGHALLLLGARNVRKWASLVALSAMGQDKPAELLSVGLTRAHFCEAAAGLVGLRSEASNLFLMGLFSVLDAVADKPIAEILEQIPIMPEVREALLGHANRYCRLLDLIRAYERARWDDVQVISTEVGIDGDLVPGLYVNAIAFAAESLSLLK